MTRRDDLVALREKVRVRVDHLTRQVSWMAECPERLCYSEMLVRDKDMLCILDALIEGEG